MLFIICYVLVKNYITNKKKINMKFTIKCIKDYITHQDEILFHKGKKYKLIIEDNNTAIVMYDKLNGTKFHGSLDEYFKNTK